jgi:hypothetical protein
MDPSAGSSHCTGPALQNPTMYGERWSIVDRRWSIICKCDLHNWQWIKDELGTANVPGGGWLRPGDAKWQKQRDNNTV